MRRCILIDALHQIAYSGMVKDLPVFQVKLFMFGQQHDLRCLKRCAAEIEKAVSCTDLIFRYFQHLREDAAHSPLTCIARRDIGALYLDRLVGQRTLVDLAV